MKICRVRQVLKSHLNVQNNIQAIKTYALLPIMFLAGIIWPKEEKEATDIKIRKICTIHGGFQPKSSTLYLYSKEKRKEGV